MSIKENMGIDRNEEKQILTKENKGSNVEKTTCFRYLQNEECLLVGDSDDCNFVKGYN
jgi:hypothetical protein